MKRNRRLRRQRRSLAKRIFKWFGWRGLWLYQSGEISEAKMRKTLMWEESGEGAEYRRRHAVQSPVRAQVQ